MTYNIENSNFDAYADDIADYAGQPIDNDPFSTDPDVASYTEKDRQAELLLKQAKANLAHTALQAPRFEAPALSDLDAPKRDRARLRNSE